jgi:cysteine desulfurase
MNDSIKYYDAAATTPVDPRVLEKMTPYFSEIFGNASSNHAYGREAKKAIEEARHYVAELINAEDSEIYFTSGATESINWAIKGILEANPDKGNHIITVKTEHKAVLKTCEFLETKGYEVTYLNVDENGLIQFGELEDSITENTCMICVMYVNNEIGVIQDIPKIGKLAREKEIVFFCDATQAVGKIPVDVFNDQIDMLCYSGHKMNGPKGIGVLYVKNGIEISPLIHGGGQEKGLRGGTYNTPLIVGLGESSRIANKEMKDNIFSLTNRRKEISRFYESNNIGTVNFKDVPTAPHIISITLRNQDAEDFLMMHSKDLIASTGSACSSSIIENSHVLMQINNLNMKSVIRISLAFNE